MNFEEQVKILKKANQVHGKWYRTNYPDVEMIGMDATRHYLKYGAAMGRNPQKWFDTKFYLETYPEVAESGLNPALHYVLYGASKGYKKKPDDPIKEAKRDVNRIRGKLLSLGFIEQPIIELEDLANNSANSATRAFAARELALWYMREKATDTYKIAIEWLFKAKIDAPDLEFKCRINTAILICYYYVEMFNEGQEIYNQAVSNGEIDADVILSWVNYFKTSEERCVVLNRVLNIYGIPPISLSNDTALSAYDRLTCNEKLDKVALSHSPKVTVLVASYNASKTIPTTLRSLQEQTWQNLEILVLDDCSTDDTREVVAKFANTDSRIKLIPMKKNGGAYVARNHGLDIATGDLVTIHDADDWSHPIKIETQVRFMNDNPEVMGCTSQQARAYADLGFGRWTGQGQFIITNTSSFMFRREPMREELGYWDTVRFSADNELVRRMKEKWGKDSVVDIKTGPLSFQRDSDSSIIADDIVGINGFLYGARKEYLDSQKYYHKNSKSLKYTNNIDKRPFDVPVIMRPDRKELSANRHYDVIITSEFRMPGGSVHSCIEEIKCAHRYGLKVAILEMYRYDLNTTRKHMLEEIRSIASAYDAHILTYGEEVSCDNLIVRYPPILQYTQRYVPKVEAKSIKIIINQPPMSDYSDDGVVRYDLSKCAKNIRTYFGKDAVWYPIGPLVRQALHEHHADQLNKIILSDSDWYNIIDFDDWKLEKKPERFNKKLKIGRHSRDNFAKWPDNANDLLAAYPDSKNIEVHVLGGVKSALEIIGNKPENWFVHEFGAISPQEFLKTIDVFIYFSHPNWVESFGRTIIEAIAAGVPVILPEQYEPLFGEAAIYATPNTALEFATELFNNQDLYSKQVSKARNYIEAKFSYQTHFNRLMSSEPKEVAIEKNKNVLPERSGKTSAKGLHDVSKVSGTVDDINLSEKVLFSFEHQKHRFDFLWNPKPGAKRIFVLFSGDAQRSKNEPPVFQRWSWSDHFPGHCLYISDPSLHLNNKIGLAWYTGDSDYDPNYVIKDTIEFICRQLHISNDNITSYGSSGGGFAALRLGRVMPEINIICINPQTVITEYHQKSVERYITACFNEKDRKSALLKFPDRMSILSDTKFLKNRKVVYIQNVEDTHHYEKHYLPFCDVMNIEPGKNSCDDNINSILFSHNGGHAKAETPEVFAEAMKIICSK